MLTTHRLSRCLSRTQERDGSGYGPAFGVSYHDNKFRPSHRAAIFRTGQYLATDNITGHTDTKNISHTEIEDQFNGCAGIDATECHGQRVLCVGGRADLTTEVS